MRSAGAGLSGQTSLTTEAAYSLVKAFVRVPMRWAWNVEVTGRHEIPEGAVILAANHRSFMDSLFLGLVVDRPVHFLAKAEYFDDRRVAWLFRSTGQIPLRRGSPAGARHAMAEALAVLAGGGVIGAYPEGTRSRDGRLHTGKLGPARLAAASGAPIVPVGLVGTERVQPPGRRLPRIGQSVQVRFGSPIQIAAAGRRGDVSVARHQLRLGTDRVMSEVAALCGQEVFA